MKNIRPRHLVLSLIDVLKSLEQGKLMLEFIFGNYAGLITKVSFWWRRKIKRSCIESLQSCYLYAPGPRLPAHAKKVPLAISLRW